ncbi:YSC84-related protein [Crenobacter sp. SG2303]|uniref:YSC84-related protein n=1 Tax=Crenobacter oryzisoli TaxID=3056844 RepID=A0ABT7XTP0_9NEIS|nr:YSC84-related protein [Crenobacter sp. SG2303]MDN0077164.1 YSC84-related protein [Crenobacter sp. SG2303]
MTQYVRMLTMISLLAVTAACSTEKSQSGSASSSAPSSAASAVKPNPELDAASQAALTDLYAKTPKARELAGKAKAILVFPYVWKGGVIAAVEHGKGELIENGRVTGHYSTSAFSAGMQAGAQKFGYAMFFMTDSALKSLKTSSNFEVGIGPSIVVVDAGVAKNMSTTTLQSDIYAFIFDQTGLMAGMGLRGAKISRTE